MINWHALETKEVFAQLKTTGSGLNFEEAEKRLVKYGPNKLPEEKRLTRLKIFLDQFRSPLIYILFFAVVVTAFLGDFIDTGIILFIIFLNTFFGYFQESKAEKTIVKLSAVLQFLAKVSRDGREQEIKVEEIVPGDIILVEAGDRVPADARLIEAKNLQINEAILTGEAMPSVKAAKVLEAGTILANRENMIYMGTSVISGRGKAAVVETGKRTELGEIVQLTKATEKERTPLQKQLAVFSSWLTVVIIILTTALFFLGLTQGKSLVEMFLVSVAVAVASVPEGLVVALTIILAIGMQRVLKEKVLVRKLTAAETLGSVSVICSDKTGTLTLGKMLVDHIFTETQSEKIKMKALEIGLLCNNAVVENPDDELKDWKIFGDALDQALLLAAKQSGLDWMEERNKFPRLDEIPFNEENRLMMTLHESREKASKGKKFIFVKGAPEKFLIVAKKIETDGRVKEITVERKKRIQKEIENLTGKGLRLIAVAYMDVNENKKNLDEMIKLRDLNDLVFVGLIALKDPLRVDAGAAVNSCREASIRPILVTGDHPLTAKTIASEIGLRSNKENILEGELLDKMSDNELNNILKNVDVYARVLPRHKLRIIEAWQGRGEVVAMTGDGVNDTPALKRADVGVALGSGTDVAKETADIILLDNSFGAMVGAIEQGRVIFENIKKIITYFLADGFCELVLVGASIILGTPLPVLAAQILWVNLVEDSLPAIALAFEPAEKDLMKEKPRRRNAPILDTQIKVTVFLIGLTTDLILFGLFYYLLKTSHDVSYAQTMIFVGLASGSLFYVWSCKTLRSSLWRIDIFANKFLNWSVLGGFAMLAAAVYWPFLQQILRTVPIGLLDWIILLVLSFFNIILIEIVKYIFIVRRKNQVASNK